MTNWLVPVTAKGYDWTIQVWQPADTAQNAQQIVQQSFRQLGMLLSLSVGDATPAPVG